MDDWEASRMKQGNISNQSYINKTKLPIFTHIDDDSITTDLEKLQISLQNLEKNKMSIKEQLEKCTQKKESILASIDNLKKTVKGLKE